MKDYLGTEITEGERGIRVHAISHMKSFKKITVVKIDATRTYGDCIGIITDGNTKIGWTYPNRLIMASNFKTEI